MDYAALKRADAELGIEGLAEAATALNAQTVQVACDIATSDARAVLLLNGDWFGIKQLGRQDYDAAPAALRTAIAAADIAVDTLTLTTTLHTADPDNWSAMLVLIGGLHQVGVLSDASIAAWTAMRAQTRPRWNPPVTPGDLQLARAQT